MFYGSPVLNGIIQKFNAKAQGRKDFSLRLCGLALKIPRFTDYFPLKTVEPVLFLPCAH
jgi:hypothetical protein